MASFSSPLPSPYFASLTRNLHCLTWDLPSSSAYFSFKPKTPKIFLDLDNPTAGSKWTAKVAFFSSFFGNKEMTKGEIKQELIQTISHVDRGAAATPEDQQRIDKIACKLEALNTIKDPLKSDLLNGKWELMYTTSGSILKSQWPKFLRPNGKIYQAINSDTLRAQNMETWPFFNQATADLIPLDSRRVAVKFDAFKIAGLIPIKAPDRPIGALGQLEITYLDEEIRVSRGNKGNLFILKMADTAYQIPV